MVLQRYIQCPGGTPGELGVDPRCGGMPFGCNLDVMFPVWGVISGVSISHSDCVAFCSYDRCEVQFVAER